MSYLVESVPISQFIRGAWRLPRFQRKSTWNRRQRFNLAIGVYKQFPPGSVVVKEEDGVTILLDGRQRRETFEKILDPHNLWIWASSLLPIRKDTDEQTLKDNFSKYVRDYINVEQWQEATELETSANEEVPPAALESDPDSAQSVPPYPGELGELIYLLRWLLLVHRVDVTKNGEAKGSPLTRAFDMRPFLKGLPYIDESMASGMSLAQAGEWLQRRFVEPLRGKGEAWPPSQSEDFFELLWSDPALSQNRGKGSRGKAALRDHLETEWPVLSEAMDLFAGLHHKLDQPIGKISIDTDNPHDQMKIFEIINSGGSPLTAVEILSARPEWNKSVGKCTPMIEESARSLFKRMAIPLADKDPIRRWDVAATLTDRLDDNIVIGEIDPAVSSAAFERKMTLGFQLFSGYYGGAIAKDDLQRLPASHPDVDWGGDALRNLLGDLNTQLLKIAQFQTLKSWGTSLIEITSDAIALDFLLRTLRTWEAEGKPKGAGAPKNRFVGRTIILLDRLIWEYVRREWRGSSDAKIKDHLEGDGPPVYAESVSKGQWKSLLDDVVDSEQVGNTYYTGSLREDKWRTRMDSGVVRPFLYYQAMIRVQLGENSPAEIDHIIPQTEWKSVTGLTEKDLRLRRLENSLINLALLPPEVNREKSGRSLKNIAVLNDDALNNKVERYTYIPRKSFGTYSAIKQAPALKKFRGQLLKWDLLDQRAMLISSPHNYRYKTQSPSRSKKKAGATGRT